MSLRGAIGFSRHKTSQISRIIQWFTGQKWSHSFIITDECDDRTYLMEANGKEVSYTLLKKYYSKNSSFEIWKPFSIDQNKIDAALVRTHRVFDSKLYGWLQVVGFAIKLGLKKIGIKSKNPIKLGTICSEVDWFYLMQLMPEEFGHLTRDDVSPGDLYEVMKSTGRFEIRKSKYFE